MLNGRSSGRAVLAGILLGCALLIAGARSSRAAPQGPAEPQATSLEEARNLIGEGRYAAAETAARSALKEAEGRFGPDALEAAEVLDLLVEALHLGGKVRDPESRGLAERAVAIKEAFLGADHPGLALSLQNLAMLLGKAGEYAAARPLFERALAIRETALDPEHPDVAQTLAGLANLLRNTGEYLAARPLYERALAIRERTLGPDHLDVTQSLNGLAALLWNMGEFASARPLYERALAIRERALPADHPDIARSLNLLAIVLGEAGDYSRARPLFERALAILEKALGPGHPEVGQALNNLGLLHHHIGDYPGALPLFERALATREKALGPEHPDVAQTLNNLAILFRDTGDHVRARPLFERALAIREKALGPAHPFVAESLDAFANLLRDTGDLAGARRFYERTLEIREKTLGRLHPYTVEDLVHLAHLYAMTGEPERALEDALQAEQLSRDHMRLTSATLSEREALRYAAIRYSGLDLALSLAAAGLPAALRRTVWDALIRSRALVLDEMAARHRSVAWAADPGLAQLAKRLAAARSRLANLTVRGPGAEGPERYAGLIDAARNAKEEAERALAAGSTLYRQQRARSESGIGEVAAALAADSALIAYARYHRTGHGEGSGHEDAPTRGEPFYMAFVLRGGEGAPAVVPLGSSDVIESLIRLWQEEAATAPPALPAAARRAESRYRTAGEAIRRAIWDPVAKHVKGARQVFVVTDGAIHLVSLASLPVGRERYLVETGPSLHYLSAERDLARSGRSGPVGSGLLVLGSPDFDAPPGPTPGPASRAAVGAPVASSGSGAATYRSPAASCEALRLQKWQPLPGARAEADEIEGLWRSRRPAGRTGPVDEVLKLTGPQAAEAAFKRIASGRRVIHLATHGFFAQDRCPSALEKSAAGDNPLLLSGLILAGANRKGEVALDEEDGILTAEEIASVDLSGVEWAVLSACETGVGKIEAGEGVLGLRRAFEIAGAGTLIMTLWKVKDEPARAWMRELYQGRLEGLATAQAVREASLRMIERRRVAGQDTHPFSWGAFVAAGDWR